MPSVPINVLTNLRLPPADGFLLRTFGDYLPGGPDPSWRAEKERRDLADILPLIPAAEKPDILVITSPEYLPIPTDLSSFPGTKILLITDWNVCLRFLPDLCPLFDFCYTDWPGYRLLRKAGIANVHHQPLFGHDPEAFRFQGKQRNLDVSFCGNLNAGLHSERNRLLARLVRWGRERPLHLGQAFNEAYFDILNRSRLVFNYSIRGEANMRLYEAMACGAVPLVESSNQEVGILFQEGLHFFRYEPDRLEENLDALLADPARIEAVSLAARAAVARNTKSEQIRALLSHVGRESAISAFRGPGSAGSATAPAADAASLKALVKLRVLGSGYTMPEALSELRAREQGLPGLYAETLPACLLTLMESHPGEAMVSANNVLEAMLREGGRPEPVRALLRMGLFSLHGRWPEVLEESQACLKALERVESDASGQGGYASAGTMDRSGFLTLYAHFYAPVDLGKGVTSDLNRAYRQDIAEGSPRGYLGLMRAHCLAAQAVALLALDRPREALERAERIPAGRFASLEPNGLITDACRRLGDIPRMREVLRAWFREKPLDTEVWNRMVAGLGEGEGEKAELIAFLEQILGLSRFFLNRDQAEKVRELLESRRV
ncbi:MAG: hypothetical protein JWP91_1701 [Fibrobacteres bacterium]|nr:hypothetical protein [Fibrobacterota bacterium]